MSRVKVNITMSLDGFVAGPSQSDEDPLGIGGEQFHPRDANGRPDEPGRTGEARS